ncbi:MAG: hypothetical protein MRY79_05025 [Alphaproteobacteria bacterium]|nr:hypothetical protein [Alphaproteobacteria bacterium]
MRRFLTLLVVILISTGSGGSVLAQEEKQEQKANSDTFSVVSKPAENSTEGKEEDSLDERLKFSRQMHEIWPIRPKVESALEAAARSFSSGERLSFKARMREAIDFDALQKASVEAMADIFTAEELQAMVEFYGSKEGRSVSHKTADYEAALQPILVKMLDSALMDSRFGSGQ